MVVSLHLTPATFDAGDQVNLSFVARHDRSSFVLTTDVEMTLFLPAELNWAGLPEIRVKRSWLGVDQTWSSSFTLDVVESVFPGEVLSVSALLVYQSAPNGRVYNVTAEATGKILDPIFSTSVFGKTQWDMKNCEYSYSATPLVLGERFTVSSNITLPESTLPTAKYSATLLSCTHPMDAVSPDDAVNCSYGCYRAAEANASFHVQAKYGSSIANGSVTPLESNASYYVADLRDSAKELVNLPDNVANANDVVDLSLFVVLNGADHTSNENAQLRLVLSFSAENSRNKFLLQNCIDLKIVRPKLYLNLSRQGNGVIRGGDVLVYNLTVGYEEPIEAVPLNLSLVFASNRSSFLSSFVRVGYDYWNAVNTRNFVDVFHDIRTPLQLPKFRNGEINVVIRVPVNSGIRYGTAFDFKITGRYEDACGINFDLSYCLSLERGVYFLSIHSAVTAAPALPVNSTLFSPLSQPNELGFGQSRFLLLFQQSPGTSNFSVFIGTYEKNKLCVYYFRPFFPV